MSKKSEYEWKLTIKGGPGSGNWGHAGRPGQVGGSGPGPGGGYVGKLQRAFGDSLIIEASLDDETVKAHLLSLAHVPTNILDKAASAGIKIYVGNEGVPSLDEMGYLKGQTPRGWSSGATWDDVSGCCSGKTKVLAGKGRGGTGGSVIGHEFGHAVAGTTGIDNHPSNISLHGKLYNGLRSYYKQGGAGGRAGRQELAAETLSILWRHGRKAAIDFSSAEYVRFLESSLKGWG